MVDPVNMEPAYQDGILTRPTVFVQELVANPRQTLRRYPLNMADDGSLGNSGPTANCWVANHGVGHRPGRFLRTLNMHDAEGFQFIMTNIGAPQGHQINVHRVATYASNLAIDWCPLPAAGGSNIMATCQLTGCSFIVRMHHGVLQAAHLLPHGPQTGTQLHNHLQGQGYLATYGRENYNHQSVGAYDRSVSIVGVRNGGNWRIYAQKTDRFSHAIRSVHKIYP